MEARIAKLEADMAHVLRDTTTMSGEMKDVRERLARVEVKIDRLPSHGFIVAAVMGSLSLFAALALFWDQLRSSAA